MSATTVCCLAMVRDLIRLIKTSEAPLRHRLCDIIDQNVSQCLDELRIVEELNDLRDDEPSDN